MGPALSWSLRTSFREWQPPLTSQSLSVGTCLATIAVLSLIQRPVNTKELESILLPKGSLQLGKYRLGNCTDLVLNLSAAALSKPRNLTRPQLSHLQNVMVMPIS